MGQGDNLPSKDSFLVTYQYNIHDTVKESTIIHLRDQTSIALKVVTYLSSK